MSAGAEARAPAAERPSAKARQKGESERVRLSSPRAWPPPAPPPPAPPRLRIGRSDDALEGEADAAAERALAMPDGDQRLEPRSPRLVAGGGDGERAPSALEEKIAAAAIEGLPLAKEQRGFFEPRFGHDFSAVRIHAGPAAAVAAKSAGARAFTLGDDIYFDAGEYRPDAEPGRRLLAHELAHTIRRRPGVVARRARPEATDIADADPGPADPRAEEAARGLVDVIDDEELARERLEGLDPEARARALGRLTRRLGAGDEDRPQALAKPPSDAPGAQTPADGEARAGGVQPAGPAAAGPVQHVPDAPASGPSPAHERASVSAASRMQEAIRQVSGEGDVGAAAAPLATDPTTPEAPNGETQDAPGGAAAAAAQAAVAALSGRLAALQQVTSLPVIFARADGAPGDPEMAAREREASSLATSFVGRVAVSVEALIGAALAAPARATASLDAALAALTGRTTAQSAAIHGGAEKARKSVRGQAGHVRGAIDAGRSATDKAAETDVAAAREAARKAKEKASGGVDKNAGKEKARIEKSYVDAQAPLKAVGDTAADNAVGAAAAWKKKLPPPVTDWDFLDGPVFNDRLDAKKEAVDNVAAEYGKSYRATAAEQAAKLPDGKSEVLAKVDDITRQATTGLGAQLEQIDRGANAHETGAKMRSKQSAGQMKAALDASAKQTLAAIDAGEKTHGEALEAQGAAARAALNRSVAAGISGLADGVAQASDQLIGSIRSFVVSAAEMPAPPRDELASALDEAAGGADASAAGMTAQIASAAPSLAAMVDAAREQGEGALQGTANAAEEGFQSAAASFVQSAVGVGRQAAKGFRDLSASNKTAAADIGAKAVSGFEDAEKNAGESFHQFGDKVEDNFRLGREQLLAGLWSKEGQAKLDHDMTDYADKAAKQVQPRWKKMVKVLITIVVIAVVIAITVASAGALGPVGVILLGAALGAAAGAVQTIADNLIDGEPWSKGVVKAMIVGAIGGAAGGAGGVLLKGVGSVALKIVLEAGINVAGGVAGEAVGSLAVGETINWTGALMGALIGAGIGAGLGIAGALKGKIKIGGLGKSAGPSVRPTIEPPPPPPAGKLRGFLEKAKILAPRPGAAPEVNVGAGAGGGEPSPPAPGAAPDPAAPAAVAPEAPAPQPRRAIGFGDQPPIEPKAPPAPDAPRRAIGFGDRPPIEPKAPPAADAPRRAIGFGDQPPIEPKAPPAPDAPRRAIGFGDQPPIEPKAPPAPDAPRRAIGFGDRPPIEPKAPPAPDASRRAIGFGDRPPIEPKAPDAPRRPIGFGDQPAVRPEVAPAPAGAPAEAGAAPSPRPRALLIEPSGGGGSEPIRAGGRSNFEPRASAEPLAEGTSGKGASGERAVAEPASMEPEPFEGAAAKKPGAPAPEPAPAGGAPRTPEPAPAETPGKAVEPAAPAAEEAPAAAAAEEPPAKKPAADAKSPEEHRQRLKEIGESLDANNARIKEIDAELAKARAKAAARGKEYDQARPGDGSNHPDMRKLREAREAARGRFEKAKARVDALEAKKNGVKAENTKLYEESRAIDEQLHPEKYPKTTNQKGDIGEAAGHDHMEANEGFKKIGSSKEPTDLHGKPADGRAQGIDGVYENPAPPPKYVIGEAKYVSDPKAKPTYGESSAGKQSSPEWVDANLDQAVGRAKADQIRAEGYEFWELRYDPRTKTVIRTKLWSSKAK